MESQKATGKLKPYLGIFLLTFGLVLSLSAGFIRWQRSKTVQTEALLAQAKELAEQEKMIAGGTNNFVPTDNQRGNPLKQAVAGASDQQLDNQENDSGFALVETSMNKSQCEPIIFTIGQPEKDSFDHPSDELNWVGALDVLPDYTDPFVVGENDSSDFPWRTSQNKEGNVVNHIQFTYQRPSTSGKLTISWSPGKSGSARKLIYLDETLISSTPTYQGKFVEQTWQNMPLVSDAVTFNLEPGTHTFAIKSVTNGGDPSVWDYLQLTADCP